MAHLEGKLFQNLRRFFHCHKVEKLEGNVFQKSENPQFTKKEKSLSDQNVVLNASKIRGECDIENPFLWLLDRIIAVWILLFCWDSQL